MSAANSGINIHYWLQSKGYKVEVTIKESDRYKVTRGKAVLPGNASTVSMCRNMYKDVWSFSGTCVWSISIVHFKHVSKDNGII